MSLRCEFRCVDCRFSLKNDWSAPATFQSLILTFESAHVISPHLDSSNVPVASNHGKHTRSLNLQPQRGEQTICLKY